MDNNYRFDLSDYLIHFFRDVDLDGPNGIPMPEHMGWHSPYEHGLLPAMYMMRAALRNGRLWATWSYRKGVRTIYGSDPAICFTDMPIPAFIEASRIRHARGEAMGEVALAFPKGHMRRMGALPVIYGLSKPPNSWPNGKNYAPRIFPESVLPFEEQYRYVADVSVPGTQIDWTHEREWRLACRQFGAPEYDDWSSIPGLDFYKEQITQIGVIVKNQTQALTIVHDLLAIVDSGQANEYTFGFVLVTDALTSVQDLQDRQRLSGALRSATINLDSFLIPQPNDQQMNQVFTEMVQNVEQVAGAWELGEFGGCWLWLQDGTCPLARALLRSGRVFVTREGRYLAQLWEYSDSRSLRQREAMTHQLATTVSATFGVQCFYFSVMNSDDPSSQPFYTEGSDDNVPFLNCSWAQ